MLKDQIYIHKVDCIFSNTTCMSLFLCKTICIFATIYRDTEDILLENQLKDFHYPVIY